MAEPEGGNLKLKYQKILACHRIYDTIDKVIVQESGAKGDGMASVTQRITLDFGSKSSRKPIELFVKTHTDNPSHEAMLDELRAFEKEARFFVEFLPEAKQLCEKNGMGDVVNMYPKCYYADKSIIILENLALEKQYALLQNDRHNLQTTKIVLESLAKHHAISYALMKHYGNETKFHQRFPSFDVNGWLGPTVLKRTENFFEMALNTCITIVKGNMGDAATKPVEKLKSFLGKTLGLTQTSMEWEKDVIVLNHGDFKNNNIMFPKNEDIDAEPRNPVLIDFQLSCTLSPASDLVYYLFISVDHKIRQAHLNDLLEIYLAGFNQTTKELGHPADLSNENLMQHFKQGFPFGFLFALSYVGPGLSLIKESGNMDITKLSMEEITDLFHKNLVKWIQDHPEKGKGMTEEILGLLEEYDSLSEI